MEAYAKSQGLEGRIWAVSANEINEHISEADVLLLGPQVRYMLAKMKKLGEEKGIPVDAINPIHYGMMNGEEVVKYAQKLIGS
jgi:PTS system cellobiose-specific IIB component